MLSSRLHFFSFGGFFWQTDYVHRNERIAKFAPEWGLCVQLHLFRFPGSGFASSPGGFQRRDPAVLHSTRLQFMIFQGFCYFRIPILRFLKRLSGTYSKSTLQKNRDEAVRIHSMSDLKTWGEQWLVNSVTSDVGCAPVQLYMCSPTLEGLSGPCGYFCQSKLGHVLTVASR